MEEETPESPTSQAEEGSRSTRAGYVTLVGRPNAGKSTLMNAMVGEKLSIVTPKAQTTWQRVTGIRTDEDSQMVFLDTPGLLEVRDKLQASMLEAALDALREADVVLLLLDPTRFDPEKEGPLILSALREAKAPILTIINKIDAVDNDRIESVSAWAETHLAQTPRRISALSGEGIQDLLTELKSHLPEGPFFYPADEIASEPVRFFVSELIRETVFEQFRDEIPYSVACEIGEYRESEDPIFIQATLYVNRPPQKRILVGQKGRAIRDLGMAAREKIEAFLGHRVYLDLWVKVLKGWRREPRHLRRLGYRLTSWDEDSPGEESE